MSFFSSSKPSVADVLHEYLVEDDWKFTQMDGEPIYKMQFEGDHARWQLLAVARPKAERVLVYSISDTKVPEAKRPLAAEYLTRANYGLAIGNFEMDFEDGEVRYKTSIDVEGGQLTARMVKGLFYVNALMFDKYCAGLMSVIYGGMTPVEAVRSAEAREQDSA